MTNKPYKARNLREAISTFDRTRALPFNSAEWDALYTGEGRREVQKLKHTFLGRDLGYRALFGGHSGNGKSTELNRFKGDERIRNTFMVIASDVSENLNPVDLEIVELFLLMIVESLAYADEAGIKLDGSLYKRVEKLEGHLRDTLKIEDVRTDQRTSSLELGAEASAGYSGFFVKFKAKMMAKIKSQSDYRETVRTYYRPRLNDWVELLDDIFTAMLLGDPKKRKPLLVVDGLDRMSVESALKLYVHDGQTLAMLRNASMLLTVPISVIHSPEAAQVVGTIGKITTFKNLRLSTRDGGVDDETSANRTLLRALVGKRLERSLITDTALDLAIDYCGGVFRTLIDLMGEAAVVADTFGLSVIGEEEMREAIADFKVTTSRPLTRKHWTVLAEVARTKTLQEDEEGEKAVRLQLLQGLYALEYINGSEWYDVNPLLRDGLARHLKLAEARSSGDGEG